MLAINPKIKQKAEDIRKKIFGSEVRESLASGIEAISEDVEATIGRQDYVEEQFQNVIDETTDKDVISAPELIAARNGKSNLKTRLDDEHAQVTAQLQQKADRLYVDGKVANVASGAPDETFATLEILQTRYPNGASTNKLVSENGHIYHWNNTWVDTGILYMSAGLADHTVTEKKLAFRPVVGSDSFNKFNPENRTIGAYIPGDVGSLIVAPGMNETDFIAVSPGEVHFMSVASGDINLQIAWYNADKQFLGGEINISPPNYKNLLKETPPGVYYARYSLFDNQVDNFMICSSTVYQDYQPYRNTVEQDALSFNAMSLVPSVNLFNKEKITRGKYVDWISGVFIDLPGFNITEFIPVKPNTFYTLRGSKGDQLAFYDINYNRVGGIDYPNNDGFTTPSDAYFVVMTVKDDILDTLMLAEGIVGHYEQYGYKVNPSLKLVDSGVFSQYKNVFVVSQKGGGDFKTITDAVNSVQDSAENPVTLVIMPGRYKEQINSRYRYISYVGVNKETCILYNTIGDSHEAPMEIGAPALIAGLTIESNHDDGWTDLSSRAYAIHADYEATGTLRISDCNLKSYQHAAVGIGLHNNQTVIIENCDLYADSSVDEGALYVHNRQDNSAINQRFILKNTTVISEHDYAMTIHDANQLPGGGMGDEKDTVFHFYNNMLFSKTKKKTDIVKLLPGTTEPGKLAGYISLSEDSYGNNINVLNS